MDWYRKVALVEMQTLNKSKTNSYSRSTSKVCSVVVFFVGQVLWSC